MNDTSAAGNAASSQISLMNRYSQAGLPLLQKALGYAGSTLAQGGLPAYANNAYGAARAGALESAQAQGTAARGRIASGPTDALAYKAPAFAGAATAYAKEKASIGTSKALATISQRNQLLQTMLGGGATSTNLSAAAGNLTNQTLAAGLNRGNPAYGAVVGGLAAGTPLLLQALQRNTSNLETPDAQINPPSIPFGSGTFAATQ